MQRMVTETIPQLRALSLAKKRILISELVDEVYGSPVEDKALTAALNERIANYHANPSSAKSWTEVKARLRKKR
jgi:putative addiction module component (TIGR02574 family)